MCLVGKEPVAILIPLSGERWTAIKSVVLTLSLSLGLADLAWSEPASNERYELSFSKAIVAFSAGRYEEADGHLKEALIAKSDDPEALYYVGETAVRMKRYDRAVEAFTDLRRVEADSGRMFLGLGLAYYHQGRYQDAGDLLRRAGERLPENPLPPYYRGLTSYALGVYDDAVNAFEQARQLDRNLSPWVQYYRGVMLYRQSKADEALQEFDSIQAGQPSSDIGLAARDFAVNIRQGATQTTKAWNLDLSLSHQYDSNVTLLPLGTQPPGGQTGITSKADYLNAMTLRGEFRALQTEQWTVGAGYGFYQNFHQRLNAFDVQSHAPTAFVQYHSGPLTLRLPYVFDGVSVGREAYVRAHAVRPSAMLEEGAWGVSVLELGYQDKQFQNDRFAFNSTRSGKNWRLNLTQYAYFAGRSGYVRLGYTYDVDATGGGSVSQATPGVLSNSDWAYHGHRFSAGVTFPPVLSTQLTASFDYYRQNYDNANAFSAGGAFSRHDNIYLGFVGLTRDLGRWSGAQFTGSLEYTYIRDEADIQVFNYARN
ncbi:MAG: hypothetical protein RL768_1512, partial [Nitrospirota bacterium]